jgi:lysophospholipase L1-like esterase
VCPSVDQVYAANGANLELRPPVGDSALHILAIGSSSTEGVGASSATHAYPARLAARLKDGGDLIADVENAGIGGEIAETTLRRLKAALATHWPKLVIWQVGTNDALTGVPIGQLGALIQQGIAATRAAGDQIVLVDPQLTLLGANGAGVRTYAEIVDAIGAAAHAPVFRRYAPMLRLAEQGSVAPLISRDGLHMSDLGYDCLAGALAKVIDDAAKSPASGSPLR